MSKVTLQADECLVSLALEQGLELSELVDANQALVEKRQLANCLMAGDVVEVPASQASSTELQVNQHNVIIISDVQYQLPLRLVSADLQPIQGLQVRLAALDLPEALTATTDSNGIARFTLPMAADKGLIEYAANGVTTIRPFYTGLLLPPNTEAGKKQRLNNLYASAHLTNTSAHADQLTQALAQEFDLPPTDIEATLTGQLA